MEDENGGLFPITKDHVGGIKDFPFVVSVTNINNKVLLLNCQPLSPVECVGISRINNKCSVVCVVTKVSLCYYWTYLSNAVCRISLSLIVYYQILNSSIPCCSLLIMKVVIYSVMLS